MTAVLTPAGTELLDDLQADPAAVGLSLRNIARANRWFGGRSAVHFGLGRLLRQYRAGSHLSLLDVGTGSGDLLEASVRWGARRGLRIHPLALERHPVAARLAHQSQFPTTLGCALGLPVKTKSVDVVLVSQVVHHLAPENIPCLFQECDRVARLGVIVADLRRSRIARVAFWLGARLLRFDPSTRADGLTSIRRGFSTGELVCLGKAAGVSAEVHPRAGFRLVMIWRSGQRQ
jgi:SAM-dependent methyltransferase